MKPEVSLPHLKQPAICPYPEPGQTSTCPQLHFMKIHLNNISPATPVSSVLSVFLRFHAKTLEAPLLFPNVLHASHLIQHRSTYSNQKSLGSTTFFRPLQNLEVQQLSHKYTKHPLRTQHRIYFNSSCAFIYMLHVSALSYAIIRHVNTNILRGKI